MTAHDPEIGKPEHASAKAFITGFGQYDTNKNSITPYGTISSREILAMIRNPPTRPKEQAQWFIPSTYTEHDGRIFDVQRERGLFRFLALDADKNDLPIEDVCTALEAAAPGCTQMVYASRSSTLSGRRWRALVPLRAALPGLDYADTANALYDALEAASEGVLIADRALSRAGQLVYLPNRGEHYEQRIAKGNGTLDLTPDHPIILRREETRARRAAAERDAGRARAERAERRRANASGDETKPADHYNARHTVADRLAAYGYAQLGGSSDWRSPYQSSGSFATRDYGEHWISLSATDTANGVGAETKSGHRWGDAFDLYAHFEHRGDFKAAVRTYAEAAGLGRTEHAKASEPPPRTSLFIDAATLHGRAIPSREWLVEGWIPSRTVTLFSGDGGTGKSLAATQLAVSVVTGRPWLGMSADRGRAMYLTAEDDLDELHRRLADIARAEGVGLDAFKGLTIRSLAGEDALLATFQKDGSLMPMPLFAELEDEVAALRPAVVVLDTLADLHTGQENDRTVGRQFIGLIRGLAIRHRCAAVVLSHPSLTGLNTGTGTSGSTSWNNSVRSRLYVERIAFDGYEQDPDSRRLSVKKSNYARTGTEIAVKWQDGVFIAETPPSGLERMASTAKAERVFIKLLKAFTEQGRTLNHAGGQTYAPRVFAEHPEAEGVTKRAFKTAMEALLSARHITISEDGPPSKRRQFLAIAGAE